VPGPQDGEARARGRARTFEVHATLPTLPRDPRAAVVALHADGSSAKAISGYLRVGTSTVYRILGRWAEEGPEGLEDKPHGRPRA
jgi:DNA-directed RNA polymerase specialized sigma24 family protein